MKLRKSLFMLCAAGLSLCACNSDDIKEQLPEGNGKVEVRIVAPTVDTRATISNLTTGTDGKLVLTGEYTVILTDAEGSETKTIEAGSTTKSVLFENVNSPQKVTVSLRSGVNEYTTAIDATLGNTAAAEVPAYGETTDFVVKSTTTSQSGTTTTYQANVTMAIPVARLEIGNIKLKTGEDDFSTLTVGGVYMDDLRNRGGLYNSATGYFECQAASLKEYQFGANEDQYGLGEEAVLKNSVTADFKTATIPATGYYAYNFYGATPGSSDISKNPSFKIFFTETVLTGEEHIAPIPRYAMITKYKASNAAEAPAIALQNGKIYQITEVILVDENLRADEEGQEILYNVEVVVKEAAWTIETIYADWAL